MELQNTTILPLDDAALAREIFRAVVHELPVVTMIVLGDSPKHRQLVTLADKMAHRSDWRRVVWVRDPAIFAQELDTLRDPQGLLAGDSVLGVTLSFADAVEGAINSDATLDFVEVFNAFAVAEGAK